MRKDGGSDGRGVGFYFRNVTEIILFGTRGRNARTLAPGRRQVNLIATRKREHSRKPDEQYAVIEACSPGPYLELSAAAPARPGPSGATRPAMTIAPTGTPTPTTPAASPPSNPYASGSRSHSPGSASPSSAPRSSGTPLRRRRPARAAFACSAASSASGPSST